MKFLGPIHRQHRRRRLMIMQKLSWHNLFVPHSALYKSLWTHSHAHTHLRVKRHSMGGGRWFSPLRHSQRRGNSFKRRPNECGGEILFCPNGPARATLFCCTRPAANHPRSMFTNVFIAQLLVLRTRFLARVARGGPAARTR